MGPHAGEKIYNNMISLYIIAATTILSLLAVNATHFRYASISWSRSVTDPQLITFNLEEAWKYDATWMSSNSPNLLTTSDLQINWGDSSGLSANTMQLAEISGTGLNDWFLARSVVSHRYPTNTATYKVGFTGCCWATTVQDGNSGAGWKVYTYVNMSAPVYSTPRMSGLVAQTMYRNRLNTFTLPLQYPGQPYITSYPTFADSALIQTFPSGSTLAGRQFSWTPTIAGPYAIQIRAANALYPACSSIMTWVITVIDPAAALTLAPAAPIIISTTAVFDGYNFSAGVGELIQIVVQSSSTRDWVRTNVEHNMLPINATMSACAEGTSLQVPYSPTPNCTRTFSWIVDIGAVNYDLMFMSRDNYTTGSTPIQFQLNIIPPRPVIATVSPTSGITAGGGTLTITGYNFNTPISETSVRIGGAYCTNAVISVGNILCSVPPGQGVNQSVIITFNGRDSFPSLYSYLAPVLQAISPTSGGATTGAFQLTLSGTNFGVSGQVVTVDGITQTPVSCNHYTCIVSMLPSIGGANRAVYITVAGQTNPTSNLFTWAAPALTSVIATASPTTGGTNTTIAGYNFGLPSAVVIVTIGGSSCIVTSHTQSNIYCTLPPGQGASNVVSVSVTGQLGQNTLTFAYDAPVINSIAPSSTIAFGGTFTIIGYNFGTTQGSVFIGGYPAGTQLSTITFWNDTAIILSMANGQGSSVVIVVAGSSSSNSLSFIYPPPIPYSIYPQGLSTVGGDIVTMTGINFGVSASVLFGALIEGANTLCAVSAQNATWLRCVLPPGQGTVLVRVSASSSYSITIPYTYGIPSISSLNPATPATAGQVITVIGSNLGTSGRVYANGVECAQDGSAVYTNAYITCTLPSGQGSGNTIIVSRSGQNSSAFSYTYGAPILNTVDPSNGATSGGTLITISGSNFGTSASVTMNLRSGDVSLVVSYQTHFVIFATTPAGNGTARSIRVTVAGATSSSSVLYSYDAPSITTATYTDMPTIGNGLLTIAGASFDTKGSVSITPVSGAAAGISSLCAVQGWTQTQIICTAPAGEAIATVIVTTLDARVSNGRTFAYNAPTITSISPTTADTQGGVTITFNGQDFGTSNAIVNASVGGQYMIVNSASQVKIIAGPLPSLTTLVSLFVGFGQAVVLVGGQTSNGIYLGITPPSILLLSPSTSATDGNITVIIKGTSFGPSSATLVVMFGATSVTVLSHNHTHAYVLNPSGQGAVDVTVSLLSQSSGALSFTYLPPAVSGVSPATGLSTSGGTLITVSGSNFGTSGSVFVGSDPCIITSYGHSSIICSSPSKSGIGFSVRVRVASVDSNTDQTVTYAIPLISGVSPQGLDAGGGSVLTIDGSDFFTSGSITVGGSPCVAISSGYTTSRIRCTLPPGAGINQAVIVTRFGQSSIITAISVFAYAIPSLAGVYPQEQSTEGGYTITIVGTSLSSSGIVLVDGVANQCVPSTPSLYTNIQIVCTAPANSGTVILTVVAGGQVSNNITFIYARPRPISISPTHAATTGNVIVTVFGANFGLSGSVTIGGRACTSIGNGYSQTRSECLLPAGEGASQLIMVTSKGRSSNETGVVFNYDAPVISLLSPSNGVTAGGTSMTITGTNFGTAAATVTATIGGAACPVTDHSLPTSITCTLPAGSGTNKTVRVTVQAQLSNVLTGAFAYLPPTITQLASSSCITNGATITDCPIAGNVLITVSGTNFGSSGDASITVNSVACTPVSYVGATLTCTLAAGLGVHRAVILTVAGQISNTFYLDYAGPRITANTLRLSGASLPGGSLVLASIAGAAIMVDGTNFKPTTTAPTLRFGVSGSSVTYQCAVTASSNTQITCTVPAGVGQSYVLIVNDSQQDSPESVDTLSYPTPAITSSTLHSNAYPTPSSYLPGNSTEGEVVYFTATNIGNDASLVAVYYGLSGGPYDRLCTSVVLSNFVIPSTSVACRTQPLAAGAVGTGLVFQIMAGNAYSVEGTDVYSYPTGPSIKAVYGCTNSTTNIASTINCPTSGVDVLSQAVLLTIVGTDFAPTITFRIGTSPCPLTATPTTTTAYCLLPAGVGTLLPVVGMNSATLYSVAVYLLSYAAPTITSITGCPTDVTPWTTNCVRAGDSVITITGRDFGASGALVLVCADPCTNVIHDSTTPNTRLTCHLPAGTALLQQILVVQSGQIASTPGYVSYAQCSKGSYQSSLTDYSCTLCTNGTYTATVGQTLCSTCPDGYYAQLQGMTTCAICSTGSYSEAMSSSCTSCEMGRYQNLQGQGACIECGPGYHASTPGLSICSQCAIGSATLQLGSSQCTSCAAGYYAAYPGSAQCDICTDGTYSTGATGYCTSCDPGKYQPSSGASSCIPCTQGTAQGIAGQGSCLSCESGTYSNTTGLTHCYDCDIGYISVRVVTSTSCSSCNTGPQACTPCGTGTYSPSSSQGICLSCAAGSYIGTTAQSVCHTCETGRYQESSGQSLCFNCTAGSYASSSGSLQCTSCAAGSMTNTTGQSSCMLCPLGTAQISTGQSICSACAVGTSSSSIGSFQCDACLPGYYANHTGSSSCTQCGAGSFSANPGATICTLCSLGTYYASEGAVQCRTCEPGSTAASMGQTVCTRCSTGTFASGSGQTACGNCTAGSYVNYNGADTCVACPIGTFGASSGATRCSDCAAGSAQILQGQPSCIPCAAGKYNSVTGQALCVSCAAGGVTNGTGRLTCDSCTAGTYQSSSGQATCLPCGLGTATSYTGQQTCPLCSQGSYAAILGQTACTACEIGKANAEQGALTCLNCTIGSYADTPGSILCTACAAGSFSNITQSVTCTTCAAGRAQPSLRSTICNTCVAGKATTATGQLVCSDCGVGKFSLEGNSECTPCAAGTFNNGVGASLCLNCPSGSLSGIGAVTCTPCPTGAAGNNGTCQSCDTGYYQPSTGAAGCVACPRGTSSTFAGSVGCDACLAGSYANYTGQTSCTSCPAGSFCPNGATLPIQCPAGTFSPIESQSSCIPCPAGYYTGVPGLAACIPCSSGHFASEQASTSCTPCGEGSFAYGIATVTCTACSKGSYAASTGTTICTPCAAGSAVDTRGALSCTACSVGTFAPSEGFATCLSCTIGFYGASEGALNCLQCPAGTYQPYEGASTCLPCGLGQAIESGGQAACLECEAGTYANSTGMATCLKCVPGTYSAKAERVVESSDNTTTTDGFLHGASTCTNCASGTYAESDGQAFCRSCLPGTSSSEGQVLCTDCSTGKYQSSIGQTSCIGCGVGTYAETTGLATCASCKVGTFGNVTGLLECRPCLAGFYQPALGQTECLPCAPGTSSDGGLPSCTECGDNTVAPYYGTAQCFGCQSASAPNELKTNCDCQPGYFLDDRRGISLTYGACLSCIDGADCTALGSKFSTLAAIAGYWRATAESSDFYRCLSLSHCAGGIANNSATGTCLGNRDGLLCAQCKDGYLQRAWGSCEPCSGNGNAWAGFIIVLVVVAFLVWLQLYIILYSARDITTKVIEDLQGKRVVADEEGDEDNGLVAQLDLHRAKTVAILPQRHYSQTTGAVHHHNDERALLLSAPAGTGEAGIPPVALSLNTSGGGLVPIALGSPAPLPPPPVPPAAPAPADRASPRAATTGGNDDSVELLPLVQPLIPTSSAAVPTEAGRHHGKAEAQYLLHSSDDDSDDQYALHDPITAQSRRVSSIRLDIKKKEAQDHVMEKKADKRHGNREFLLETLFGEHKPLAAPPNFSFKLKIFIGFIQIISSVNAGLELRWPDAFKSFVQSFDVLNFDWVLSSVLGADCVFTVSYYLRYVVVVLVPPVLFVIITVAMMPEAFGWCCYRHNTNTDRQVHRLKYWMLLLYCTFLVYPAVSKTVLRHYICKDIEGVDYLFVDLTQLCNTDQWKTYAYVGIALIIIYPVGIPVFLFWQLWINRHILDQNRVKAKLGFLYEGYKQGFWWFEVIDLIHKLLLTSIIAFFDDAWQLPGGMIIATVYLIILLVAMPYLREEDDALHLLVQCVVLLMLQCGHVFNHVAIGDYSEDVITSVLLVAMAILVFLVWLRFMLKARYVLYLAEKKKEREAIKNASGGSAADMVDSPITRATSNTVDRGVMRSPNSQRQPQQARDIFTAPATGDRAPPSNHRASMIR